MRMEGLCVYGQKNLLASVGSLVFVSKNTQDASLFDQPKHGDHLALSSTLAVLPTTKHQAANRSSPLIVRLYSFYLFLSVDPPTTDTLHSR